jgi:putative membrane protein
MSELASDNVTARGERLHPLFLLTGLGKVIRGAWGIAVGGAFFAFNNRPGTAILLVGGFIVFSIASLLVKWLTFEFRLDAHELRIDQGLVSRSSRAIPFDRVTDVDIEQGPLHRLLGLARVRMETGASSAPKDEEGVLDTVTLDRAEAIREFVRARRRGATAVAVSDDQAETDAAAPPLFAMDLRRVIIAGLFNFSLAVIAVLFGATQTFGDLIGFDPFKRAFWSDLLANAAPLRDFVMAHQVVTAMGGTLVLLLIGIGTGIVRTLLRDYGFRLDRTDSGFRRRRGLLTLTDVTIPARRVQASILATGPIRRAFGWFSLRFQSLAMDDKQGDHVVAPLAHLREAQSIQFAIGRPIAPQPENWRKLPIAFVTSAAIPLLALAVLAAIVATIVQPVLLLTAVGFGMAAAVRWAEWRHARYALDDGHLFIDQGFWRQRRSIVPVGRIQSLDLTETFWTRLFGFCRMRLGIAGGSMLSAFSIDALSRGDAHALRDRLLAA